MSAKFAAWLRVTPSPVTLAESGAIYQALRAQGRINTFIKRNGTGDRIGGQQSPSSTYYAVFSREPPSLRMTFDVPVYHSLSSARDEDPFNIRGLQDRKPMPTPKTFKCTLERAQPDEVKLQEENIRKHNPLYGPFKVEKNSWLRDVLVNSGATPAIANGCSIRISGGSSTDHSQGQRNNVDMTNPESNYDINTGAVPDTRDGEKEFEPFHRSRKNHKSTDTPSNADARVRKPPTAPPLGRMALQADKPLGPF